MNIYNYIRTVATEREIQVRDMHVATIAGLLFSADFPREMSPEDQIEAKAIVAGKLNRLVGAEPFLKKAKQRTAEALEASTNEDSFKLIDDLVRSNKCPKCAGALKKVSLDNYEEIKYCQECRLSIWDNDEA